MYRWILVLAAATAGAAGCTTSYRVHVNTYSELGEPLSRTAPIYVATDPNSRNPILARQIEAKIRELLRGNGYNPVATAEAADYTLTSELGMSSDRVVDYTPIYRPYGGFYGGHFYRGWGFGYTTYMPYIDTVYTHWLRMRLYSQKAGGPDRQNVVWLGEAVTGTDDPDLREAVNYLLVACLEFFATDTREWVTVKIEKDDPRVLGIMEMDNSR